MTTTIDSTQSDTQMVIVTQEKKRRLVPLVAAAAGAALLGGTTFALWSASDTLTGGDIVAGDLNIVGSDAVAFYDVSADRDDATTAVPGTGDTVMGHAVASTWRIVPGDKVAAAFEAEVTLVGDNMVAKLSLDGIGTGDRVNTGMTYTYEVYEGDTVRVAETVLPAPDDADTLLLYLAAPETGQGGLADAESTTPVYAMTDETEALTVVIYGTFDEDTVNRDQVTVTDTLGNLTLLLEQVRDAGAVFIP